MIFPKGLISKCIYFRVNTFQTKYLRFQEDAFPKIYCFLINTKDADKLNFKKKYFPNSYILTTYFPIK